MTLRQARPLLIEDSAGMIESSSSLVISLNIACDQMKYLKIHKSNTVLNLSKLNEKSDLVNLLPRKQALGAFDPFVPTLLKNFLICEQMYHLNHFLIY